ncbi:hypothetical protein GCM10010319_45510 [Streptomyces blastmyceticus]|uniref:Uncharacterized protein n=1 Tax=Streptomyces blastmyceticus TaxID=68180 RepID=A0ABN0XFA9_9ACTN
MGALLGGVPHPADDRLGVPGEVADTGVDLIQSETKLSHDVQCNRLSDAIYEERCECAVSGAISWRAHVIL